MKKTIATVAAKVALISAKAASNSASLVGFYQPVAPKQLKNAKKA